MPRLRKGAGAYHFFTFLLKLQTIPFSGEFGIFPSPADTGSISSLFVLLSRCPSRIRVMSLKVLPEIFLTMTHRSPRQPHRTPMGMRVHRLSNTDPAFLHINLRLKRPVQAESALHLSGHEVPHIFRRSPPDVPDTLFPPTERSGPGRYSAPAPGV